MANKKVEKRSIYARDAEVKLLSERRGSGQAEFIAVYGRRRVGKTFLIREYFKGRSTYCEVMGVKDAPKSQQLEEFRNSLSHVFYGGEDLKPVKSWKAAFEKLLKCLETKELKEPFVLFLDELPWLATPKSGLLSAIDYYWNKHLSQIPNFKLVVCGSAASWMMDKIIDSKGGLHNRLTYKLHLKPFDLAETKAYLAKHQVRWPDKKILDLYMVTGGIPYYLDQINANENLAQNINRLCFKDDGLLFDEFEKLFRSLFDQANDNLNIARAIANVKDGLSRNDLIKKLKLSSGGNLKKRLAELEAAGFIRSYIPFGKVKRETYYRMVDEYSLFYIHWIEAQKNSGYGFAAGFWQTKQHSPAFYSWAGNAFEMVAIKHVEQIRYKLGLSRIACRYSGWRLLTENKSNKIGAQIDLLIDRDDGVISVCDMKYADSPYVLDKAMAKNMSHKIDCFQEATKTDKMIECVFITIKGVKAGLWADDLVDAEVQLTDLFVSTQSLLSF